MHSMRLSSKWHMHRVHLLLGAEALVNLFLCSLFGFSMSYASRRTRTRSYGLVSKRPLDHLGVSLPIIRTLYSIRSVHAGMVASRALRLPDGRAGTRTGCGGGRRRSRMCRRRRTFETTSPAAPRRAAAAGPRCPASEGAPLSPRYPTCMPCVAL